MKRRDFLKLPVAAAVATALPAAASVECSTCAKMRSRPSALLAWSTPTRAEPLKRSFKTPLRDELFATDHEPAWPGEGEMISLAQPRHSSYTGCPECDNRFKKIVSVLPSQCGKTETLTKLILRDMKMRQEYDEVTRFYRYYRPV